MDLMYELQHKAIPYLLFKDTDTFVYSLTKKEDILFRMYDSASHKCGKTNPYKKEEFRVEPVSASETEVIIRIVFPEPDVQPLCYEAYIFFGKDFCDPAYFTVEMSGIKFRPENPFLCGYNKSGAHLNYGEIEPGGKTAIEMCKEIYKNKTGKKD